MVNQSVEEVILWELNHQKESVKELEVVIKKHREVYSFPNERDGVPDSWSWGGRDYTEVSVDNAMLGIRRMNKQIELIEEELSKKETTTALRRLFLLMLTVNSVMSKWSSQSSTRAYRYINNYREKKSSIAKKSRKNKPSKDDLWKFKYIFESKHGRTHGWKNQAQREFEIDPKTLNKIIK